MENVVHNQAGLSSPKTMGGPGSDASGSAVVRAIVAEGVETEGQLNELSRYDRGDIMVQGYHFSRPITAGEFEQRYLSEASTERSMPDRRQVAASGRGA